MKRKRERERKVKESDTVSGGESTSVRERRGGLANVKEEERQQAEVTRRFAGTDASYVDPPSDKAPR